MKNKTKSRALASLLALVMLLGMLPMSVLAARVVEDDAPVAETAMGEEAVTAAPKTDAPVEDRDAARLSTADEAATRIAKAQLGTDANFAGDKVDLSNALYTFATSGTGYTVSNTVPGTETTVYLNIGGGATNGGYNTRPNMENAGSVTIACDSTTYPDYPYAIRDTAQLYFQYNNSSKLHFDRNGGTGEGGRFALFQKDEEATDSEIPGYRKVTDTTVAEGQFLIAAPVTTSGVRTWYVLYPSADANKYAHVAKVVLEDAETEPAELYTPEQAVEDGLGVHYFVKANGNGWTFSDTAAAVTLRNTSGANFTDTVVEGSYRIYNTTHCGPFHPSTDNTLTLTGQSSGGGADCNLSFAAVEGTRGGFTIRSEATGYSDKYFTNVTGTYTHNGVQWTCVELGEASRAETFYVTPVVGQSGSYYIWYTTEREPVVTPPEQETIEHHTPTEGWDRYYLQFAGSTWSGSATASKTRLDSYADSIYTRYTDADVSSGTYAIYSQTGSRWMHVEGSAINRCQDQEDANTHRFTFAYDAAAKGYTIQSLETSKYLCAGVRGALSMGDTGTIFYIDKVEGEDFYYVWWENEPQPGEAISEMYSIAPDNTWVFTGGADVEGNFEQTRGKRNFMGHFEEYVRWTYPLNKHDGENNVGGYSYYKQRHTINTAYDGLTLKEIAGEKWEERVGRFQPKAVVYMVGQDELTNAASFAEDLGSFIDKALALRDNNGFAVIIKSYDSALSELNSSVDQVVAGYAGQAAKYTHIVVVDGSLTDAQLTNGRPNAAGHLELSKKLVTAVCPGSSTSGNYPGGIGIKDYPEAEMPDFDRETKPTVAFADGVMTISGLSGEFTYQVKLASGVTVSGEGTGSVTVTDLPDGETYTLVTRSADGETQYQSVYGTVNGAEGKPALNSEQQKIAALIQADRPLTWLFMGDSITHACHWLGGYDSVAQLTEEFLTSIGRDEDVVVNTAVSSATTQSTLNGIEYRLNRYPAPDVVAIMLGTNDNSPNLTGDKYISKEQYKTNLGLIAEAIRAKNPNAVIVLRTPSGFWDSHPHMFEYIAELEDFAEEQGLILVDQMTPTQHAIETYPWCKSTNQFFGNSLHPGALGQLLMAQMLIRDMGLWDEDNQICNLDYPWAGMTTESSAANIGDGLITNGSRLTLSASVLGANLGRTTLTATNEAGQSWTVTAEAGENPALTLPDGTYTVTATSIKTNEAKTVNFAEGTVEIDANAEPSKMPAPVEPKAYEYQLVVDEMTEGFYVIMGTANRNATMHDSGTTTDQCGAVLGADQTVVLNHNEDKWTFVKQADGTYAIRSNGGKYLTSTASGVQLALSETAENFTVTCTDDGQHTVQNAAGKYLAFPDGNPKWGFQDQEAKVKLFRRTEVEPELAQTVFKGTSTDQPLVKTDTGSKFRIPSLYTLSNGWLMASADARWNTTGDSPANLDTIVSISKDGGATWSWEIVNYLADYVEGASNRMSASFIDPAVVQDSNGTIYMLVDLQSPYINGGNRGNGFDDEGRMEVGYIADPSQYTGVNAISSYDYYVDINNAAAGTATAVNMTALNGGEDETVTLWPICLSADDSLTGYYVDAFFNTYYDYGEGGFKPVIAVQHGSSKAIHNNLFYTQSTWRAYPTAFIMLRTATINDEGGLDWSAPYLLNDQIKYETEAFIGVCPGRGNVISLAGGGERIIFPVYDNINGSTGAEGGELASVIYSDDGGVTWHRGEHVLKGEASKTSESQIVELPDGNGGTFLRIYCREGNNGQKFVAYADSFDNGVTWTAAKYDRNLPVGHNTMISFISLKGTLHGPDGEVYENLILGSYPMGAEDRNHGDRRTNGVVRIGSYSTETGQVTWLNPATWSDPGTIRYPFRFTYSCVTQWRDEKLVPMDRFSILYEDETPAHKTDAFMELVFDTFTVADLLGEGWTLEQEKPAYVYTANAIADQTHTGSAIEPAVTVLRDGEVMTEGYTVVYSDNIDVGVALAMVLVDGETVAVVRFNIVAATTPTPTPEGPSTNRPSRPVEEDLEDLDVPLAGLTGSFSDVKKTDWFYDATEFVASAGLMLGVSETDFQPTMNTTRGMIVTILYRMEQEPEVDPAGFMDVSSSSWYSSAAGWGEQTGIAKGMSDGNFYAMQDVTREQLAVFLYRFAEHRGYDVSTRGDLTAFHDGAKVSSWAEDAVSWAVATGLIKGKGEGGLDPLSTATRSEVAAILMRFCKSIEEG